jgi:glycosyltransferase involved in cell wall biosynthesis
VNVVFVNYGSFDSNSAVHIFHVANELVKLGVECTVAVPERPEAALDIGVPLFQARSYAEALAQARPGTGPTLVHAWTPREGVRRFTEELSQRLGCGYFIHLEDNEEHIAERMLGVPMETLRRLPESELQVPDSLSHPVRYQQFLAGAVGVSALIDRLLEFKPAAVPGLVFWPASDAGLEWHRPRDEQLREQLGIAPEELVVVYTGNVHPANQREVSSLYLALALLRRRGLGVRLVRTGNDYAQLYEPGLADTMKELVIELGRRPRTELPAILSLADVLVQPGGPDPFNDYRFPSKLPEFLASGKPVLLPRSNIGRQMTDGENCLLLEAGNALEIATKVESLFLDRPRRERIGAAGRRFALEHFSWARSAKALHSFYLEQLGPPVTGAAVPG